MHLNPKININYKLSLFTVGRLEDRVHGRLLRLPRQALVAQARRGSVPARRISSGKVKTA
jgi:hypothetical protein